MFKVTTRPETLTPVLTEVVYMNIDFNHEHVQNTINRLKVENHEGWRDSIDSIPYLSFPSEWQIKVIPPFSGAMVRFMVKLPTGVSKSVYADFHDALGAYGKPYWEVYPVDDDIGRCDISDTETLLQLIETP